MSIGKKTNSEYSRLILYQELLAPLMSLRWTILHLPPQSELVTSDVGLGLAKTPNTPPEYDGEDGFVVPIDPTTLLAVTRKRQPGPVIRWSDEGWVALVEHRFVGDESGSINVVMAAGARNAVYGRTRRAVAPLATALADGGPRGAAIFPEVTEVDLECHMYDYFRVASAIAAEPEAAQSAADCVDWSAVDERTWTGPVAVQMMFPERTGGGVRFDGGDLYVDGAYGAEVRRLRREAGDFRKGAYALISLADVQRQQGKIAGTAERVVNLVRFDTGRPDQTVDSTGDADPTLTPQ